MNILVTGGCGFIGSQFIKVLAKCRPEYNIVNIDKLTYAANTPDLELKNYFLDIQDPEVEEVFKEHNFDYVVNFAAETHVDNSIRDPLIFVKTNVLGTSNLLNLSLKYNVKKYLQISTDEVYGSITKGAFTEKSPIDPSSPYSASKAAADHLVLSYHKTYKLDVNITRCSNNYGPHQHGEKLIPLMITKALKNEKLPVYGNGLNIRDWIHVVDHCRAVLAVLEDGVSGEVYNIGSDNEKTNIEIVELILDTLGHSKDLIEYVEDRKGHDKRYAINAAKISNKLLWSPTIDFKQGLKDTIEWYSRSFSPKL